MRSDSLTSTNKISFSWEAPINNGSPIIDYMINWDMGNETWETLEDHYSETYLTMSVDHPLTTYSFQISARNEIGEGNYLSSPF